MELFSVQLLFLQKNTLFYRETRGFVRSRGRQRETSPERYTPITKGTGQYPTQQQ